MDDAATCPDCGGELYISPAAPSDADTSEPASARVGVCTACDEGWRQDVDTGHWTRVDVVGTRHP